MEQLYETELSLLRSAIWGTSFEPPQDFDREALLAELRGQTVLGIACSADLTAVPEEIRLFFHEQALRRGAAFYRYLYAQEQLLALLEEAEIPAVILKGTAAAEAYPYPEQRTMGDVDFLVPPACYDAAYEQLVRNGYQLVGDIDENPKHVELCKEGTAFELHRSFGSIRDAKRAGIMQELLQDGLKHAVTGSCAGSAFPMLPPLPNGITLLYHVAQHLNGGLGLRQVIDWMLYAHKYMTDAFWEKEFRSAAESLGIVKLAVVTTRMCQMYLGLPDQWNWCRVPGDEGEETDALAKELMDYVLAVGNFGRKQEKTGKNVQDHLAKANGVFDILRQMQRSGLWHYKIIRNHKLLRPIAWIPGGARFVRKAFGRQGAMEHLVRESEKAKEKRTMLQKLEVDDAAV